MGEMSPWHWAIVILIAVLLFGARRLPDAARSLGRSARILKAELRGADDEPVADEEAEAATPARAATPPPAVERASTTAPPPAPPAPPVGQPDSSRAGSS